MVVLATAFIGPTANVLVKPTIPDPIAFAPTPTSTAPLCNILVIKDKAFFANVFIPKKIELNIFLTGDKTLTKPADANAMILPNPLFSFSGCSLLAFALRFNIGNIDADSLARSVGLLI